MADYSRRELFHMAGRGLTAAALLPGPPDLAVTAEPGGAWPGAEHSFAYHPAPVTFLTHRVGTDHAEGLAVIDMNGDGQPDIVSGAYWYENPRPGGGEWNRHKYRELAPILTSTPAGAENQAFWGEFVADNGEFAIDVNHDGALDLVTSSWQNDGVWWFENPKKLGVMWTPHFICHSKQGEGMVEADVDGDGKPEIIVAHYGRQGLFWISFAGPEPVVHYVGGREQDGHGVGVADVDGDGKPDILSVHGWFRNIVGSRDQWDWLPEWELGDCGFPIIGYDVNNDGKMDLIYGHGHAYGLFWLEQTTKNGKRSWERHLIDDSFSQVHALKLADIDADGEPELLAGKRYRGHNGNDPGSYEPQAIYYYKINRKNASFDRYTISYNGSAGAGTQFVVTDVDGDGDQDILVAGKTGVHWLENLQVNKVPGEVREKELLLDTHWPFPGEGTEIQK
jgi:hypothetical protein